MRFSVAVGGFAIGIVAGCGLGPPTTTSASLPEARFGAASAYDAADGTLVMFGGATRSGTLGDTWIWDGASWHLKHPKSSPPPRESGVMAFDPAGRTVVLFGGLSCGPFNPDQLAGCEYQGATPLSDTWNWDGNDWSRVKTQHEPELQNFASVSVGAGADEAHSQLILLMLATPVVAGSSLETWSLTAGDWRRMNPAHAPPNLGFSGPAFDPIGRHLIVQQGAFRPDCLTGPCGPSLSLDTTWAWNGSDWLDLGPGLGTPHDSGDLVADKDGVVLLGNGGAAQWTGSRWRPETAIPFQGQLRVGSTAAYDAKTNQVVVFGGRAFETNHIFGDMRIFNGSSWNTLVTSSPSSAASALAPCSPSKAERGNGEMVVQGAPDSWLYDLDFVEPNAGPCHLDVVVTFALMDSGGRNLPVAGNPSSVEVVADLTFDYGAQWATFTVANACALPQGTLVTFTAGDLHLTSPALIPPCTGAAGPVTITPGTLHNPREK